MSETSDKKQATRNKRQGMFALGIIIVIVVATTVILLLASVFRGSFILSQTFQLGPLTVHYYGITMALAVGAGWWLALRRAPQFSVAAAQADSLLQWLVLGGFAGARLYHVASSWQYYWQHPLDVFKVWHGGLSIFGALLGGLLVLTVYNYKLSGKNRGRGFSETWFRMADWLVPSLVLGQIIGRFGNFFNYEAFGYPTSLPWKMFVPSGFRPEGSVGQAYYHPLFLYEAIGNIGIFLLLLYIERRRRLSPSRASAFSHSFSSSFSFASLFARGELSLFFLYLFLYNALRFGLEFWRVDSTFIWGFLRLNTLSSGALCLVGIAGLVARFAAASKPACPHEPHS